MRNHQMLAFVAAAWLSAASLAPTTAVAAETRARVAAGSIAATPVHRFFGWLVDVNGSLLTLQLRNGKLLRVNAAPAIALNRVSFPFYHRKPTVVTGTLSGGVLNATSVTRAVPQSAGWDIDR
jgi:hypothetical protein